MASELKPCPFCGSAVEVFQDEEQYFRVDCRKCEFVFRAYPKENAVAAWNMRVDPLRDRLVQALESAEHALRSYQYGNVAPDLAKEAADHIRAVLAEEAKRIQAAKKGSHE